MKPLNTTPGVGEHSLRSRGLPELDWGSPGLQGGWGHLVLRLLGTQTPLGATLGAMEELKMECGPTGGSSPRQRRKGQEERALDGYHGDQSPWLACLGRQLGLVETVAENGELKRVNINIGLLVVYEVNSYCVAQVSLQLAV